MGRSRVAFYDVDDELNVDPAAIKRSLGGTAGPPAGDHQLLRLPSALAQRNRRALRGHGTVLLEDCAHSLLTRGSGETGDLAVVSYRKLLPVFDGGGLRIRSGTPGLMVRYQPSVYSNILSLLATVKALSGFQSQAISRAGVADRRQAMGTRPPAASVSRTLPMSWFASNGVGNAPLAEIVRRRARITSSGVRS